jgi:hypothetical protein
MSQRFQRTLLGCRVKLLGENLSALQRADYSVVLVAKGSLSRFNDIMARPSGEVPISGDER